MNAETSQFVTPEALVVLTAMAAPLLVAEYFRDKSFVPSDDFAASQFLGSLPIDVMARLPYGPPAASFPLPKGHETVLPDNRPRFHRKAS
jgi:hypothetical protein